MTATSLFENDYQMSVW